MRPGGGAIVPGCRERLLTALSWGCARAAPRVPQRHRAVEDRVPRAVVGQIGDKIAVPLELEALLGRSRGERRLDEGADDALRLRVQVIQIVALRGFGSLLLIPGDDRRMIRVRLFATRRSALDAERIARAGEWNAKQSIVQAHFRFDRMRGGKPVDVALDLARRGTRRAAAGIRIVRAVDHAHAAARILFESDTADDVAVAKPRFRAGCESE